MMMFQKVALLAGLVTALMSPAAFGQRMKSPRPNAQSPEAVTSITLSGTEVKVEYNAPSMRGRKIFGDLVPYGKVWRTGADAATTLTTSGDLMIGDLHVPKGVYSLYTLPGENSWKLIVSKQTGQWGTVYDEKQDLGRTGMKVAKNAAPVEKMEIKLKGSELYVIWADVNASVEIMAH